MLFKIKLCWDMVSTQISNLTSRTIQDYSGHFYRFSRTKKKQISNFQDKWLFNSNFKDFLGLSFGASPFQYLQDITVQLMTSNTLCLFVSSMPSLDPKKWSDNWLSNKQNRIFVLFFSVLRNILRVKICTLTILFLKNIFACNAKYCINMPIMPLDI